MWASLPALSGVTLPLHRHVRPFTTNGALSSRDKALLPPIVHTPFEGSGRSAPALFTGRDISVLSWMDFEIKLSTNICHVKLLKVFKVKGEGHNAYKCVTAKTAEAHGHPQAWARGALAPPPPGNVESVLLQMLSKTSVDYIYASF